MQRSREFPQSEFKTIDMLTRREAGRPHKRMSLILRLVVTLVLLCLVGLSTDALQAETTRRWSQERYQDFRKGAAKKISIRSDGKLVLAPRVEELLQPTASYLWDLAHDSHGNLFAAGGPQAGVFRLGADGRKSTIFEHEGEEVHALAVDAEDNLYAATFPESKVYKIDPSGRYEVFFDPGVNYIWDMAFDSKGNLFLATGDKGMVYRVTPGGDGGAYFETGETHVRSIVVDANDDLVIGTDPSGLIERISVSGTDEPRGFVLYQSSKKEITSLTVAEDGTIYAAGVGDRRALPGGAVPVTAAPRTQGVSVQVTTNLMPRNQAAAAAQRQATLQAPPPAALATRVTGGSEVYRISAAGEPRRVWRSRTAIAYALVLDPQGRLLIGTGERGGLYRVESETAYTLLLSSSSAQVTALSQGPAGKTLIATSNAGKVYSLGPELESEGSFESEVFDAKIFSQWGRLEWRGAPPESTTISVSTRSGNLNSPTRNWSEWSAPIESPEGQAAESPSSRFVQWRAVLKRSGESPSPELDAVAPYYLPRNVAPLVSEIEPTSPNYRFAAAARPQVAVSRNMILPPLGQPAQPQRLGRPTAGAKPGQAMSRAKGRIGVRWLARDENQDRLVFKVEIRGEGEQNWKLLEEDVTKAYHDWDATSFADGFYRVRITASDSPSNPASEAETHSKISEPFPIDNSAPSIRGIQAEMQGDSLRVRLEAVDEVSMIRKAEYSLDGGEWKPIRPVSRLFDSKSLSFDFETEQVEDGEHTLAVRVYDRFENVATGKTVVR
jgi:sugar lactone lactonase YvrE